jgi:hypothetical protein
VHLAELLLGYVVSAYVKETASPEIGDLAQIAIRNEIHNNSEWLFGLVWQKDNSKFSKKKNVQVYIAASYSL